MDAARHHPPRPTVRKRGKGYGIRQASTNSVAALDTPCINDDNVVCSVAVSRREHLHSLDEDCACQTAPSTRVAIYAPPSSCIQHEAHQLGARGICSEAAVHQEVALSLWW